MLEQEPKTAIQRFERSFATLKKIVVALTLLLSAKSNASTATVTVSGAEQGANGVWDAGTLTLQIGNKVVSITYGQFSTASSVASGLAATLAKDCASGVKAKATGNALIIRMPDGSTISSTTAFDSIHFSGGSFRIESPIVLNDTSATLTADKTAAHPSETVTFTASVAPAVASGSVTLTEGQTSLGTVSLLSGIATFSTSSLSPGTHYVKASYSGDSVNAGSTSNSVSVLILPASAPASSAELYSYSIANSLGQSGYSASGNISDYVDSVTGRWHAEHDSLNRLREHSAIYDSSVPSAPYSVPSSSCWLYDSFGNRTAAGIAPTNTACPLEGSAAPLWMTRYLINPVTNQVAGSYDVNNNPVLLYNFDEAGNMMQADEGMLSSNVLYDGAGRVCATQQLLVNNLYRKTGYLYDADGVRVAKGNLANFVCDFSPGNFTISTEYLANGSVSTEFDESGAFVRSSVSLDSNSTATYTTDGNGPHFSLNNWLGTKRVQTRLDGSPEASWASLPYGEQRVCVNCNTEASSDEFTGKARDKESGFLDFSVRTYSSDLGRFTSPDPLGPWLAKVDDPQSWNFYSYARNNPLVDMDPSGFDCVYFNDAGDGVESIDRKSDTAECYEHGGDWVNGHVDSASYFANSDTFGFRSHDESGTYTTYGSAPGDQADGTGCSGNCISGYSQSYPIDTSLTPYAQAVFTQAYNNIGPIEQATKRVVCSAVGAADTPIMAGSVVGAPIPKSWVYTNTQGASKVTSAASAASKLLLGKDPVARGTFGQVLKAVTKTANSSGGTARIGGSIGRVGNRLASSPVSAATAALTLTCVLKD